MHNKTGEYMMQYFNMFFFYSIFGYICETLMYKIKRTKSDSGIFIGPITPIYGVGAVIIKFISDFIFDKYGLYTFKSLILIFILSSIILTILEEIGGIFILKVFNKSLWNYKRLRFNIGKYIALEVSIIWGIVAILFSYFINPIFDTYFYIIPKAITCCLIVLFNLDILCSIIESKKGK